MLAQSAMPNKIEESAPNSARKAWDVPHDTIIKALENAELRLLNTENQRFEETLKASSSSDESKVSALKRGQTFIIDKKTNRKLPVASQHNTLLVDEKPPEVLGNINSFEDVASMESIIAPLKQAIMLGLTLGKFDAMNTKMLRTCSEPDLTKLMTPEEEKAPDSPKKAAETEPKDDHSLNKMNTCKMTGTMRCARSLEDLNKMSEDVEIVEGSSDDASKVCLSLYFPSTPFPRFFSILLRYPRYLRRLWHRAGL